VTARTYAAAISQHPLATHAVGETVGTVLEQLDGEPPDLLVLFVSPHHVGTFEDIVMAVQRLLSPGVMIGGTALAVIGVGVEVESEPAISIWAARLPGARLTPLELDLRRTADGPAIVGWPEPGEVEDAGTLLLFADPFSLPVDALLERINEDAGGLEVIGGMASAAHGPGGNRLVLGGRIRSTGAVGVFLGGDLPIQTIVSQGCRPVGQPLLVTRSDGNLVEELALAPAIDRVRELASTASEADLALLRQGLHLGVVVDEHRADFGRGDFLVRNVLGADSERGAITVGDVIEVGRTVQFHVRDAGAADDDLRVMLAEADPAGAALLFTCTGRGARLFGEPDHDAGLIEDLLGPLPLAGAFCAGEIGPVGGKSFLHGFTASLALFPR
jgi:small ligand-binding sensory domain FIST